MPLSDELTPQIHPGDDFYAYVNKKWVQNNPIPDSKAYVGVSTILEDGNTEFLRELLAQSKKDADHTIALAQTFYQAAMDEPAIEKYGLDAVAQSLDQASRAQSPADVIAFITRQHASGHSLVWNAQIEPDDRDSERYILRLYQAGLGLPDRDTYFDKDEQSATLRQKYQELLRDLLAMLNEPQAAELAGAVFELETKLAEVSLTGTQNRDPVATYHLLSRADLASRFPGFDWIGYLAALGLDELPSIVVSQPEFLQGVMQLIVNVPAATWSAYLRLHTIIPILGVLPSAFSERGFDFYGRVVSGAKEREPRYRRIVRLAIQLLPEGVGKLYVGQRFQPEAKASIQALVDALQTAMLERLQDVDWLDDTTKQAALTKLDAFLPLLGYPDTWRSYEKLELGDHHAANYLALEAEDWNFRISRIAQPVDKHEWVTSPAVVNAFYWPTTNSITFPAGILQPPYFDAQGDMAANFGSIGVIIGHEITHGFDDQGSQFDGQGNLKSWWSEKDRAAFVERAAKLKEQFDGYTVLDKHVNGALTLGENVADLGGLLLALDAMHYYGQHHELAKEIDDFTADQRFFMSYAASWRGNTRPELAHMLLVSDPHAPEELRVNGALPNVDAFYEAFEVGPAQKLYKAPEDRVRVW